MLFRTLMGVQRVKWHLKLCQPWKQFLQMPKHVALQNIYCGALCVNKLKLGLMLHASALSHWHHFTTYVIKTVAVCNSIIIFFKLYTVSLKVKNVSYVSTIILKYHKQSKTSAKKRLHNFKSSQG